MARLITIDSTRNEDPAGESHNIRQNFKPTLILDGPYELALSSLNMYYSWRNIDATLYQNSTFRYREPVGPTWRVVTLENGVYTFKSLVDEIHRLMKLNGDYTVVSGVDTFDINFDLDLSTQLVTMALSSGYQVDFTDRNIRNILGFLSQTYTAASNLATNKADIFNGVHELQVACNLCSFSSYENGNASSAIYSFSSNLFAPNQQVSISPQQKTFLPIRNARDIQQIHIYLVDQLGRPINTQRVHVSYVLVLRPQKM